jgi:outer membrane protein OmpA-like peptidoglycan-associated protein
MNNPITWTISRKTMLATAMTTVLLAACAGTPMAPDGAVAARAKLSALQADPNLASRAPVAIDQADAAVRIAEQPEKNVDLVSHRVYVADRKIEIARAQAETRYAEDQRTALSSQREAARLDSRTREADSANAAASVARNDADLARSDADAANAATAELQRQIDAMQAKVTDRGLVLTLGDVLFATGTAELRSGATSNLDQLVTFLGNYPTRTVMIEGHTDNVGSGSSNQLLSERRADSVRSHLVRRGIDAGRLTTSGAGESTPVASNDSAAGRQQNRRVEVIISNPALAAS